MQLLNTLFVTLPDARLRLDSDTHRIDRARNPAARAASHHPHRRGLLWPWVVGCHALHARLADEGHRPVLLDDQRALQGRLEGLCPGNVLAPGAVRACGCGLTLDIAASFVAGKIKTPARFAARCARSQRAKQKTVLTRGADDPRRQPARPPGAATLDAVRGLEGDRRASTSAACRSWCGADLREALHHGWPHHRPPRGSIQCLLSFLYAMWMNDCRSALRPQAWIRKSAFCTPRPGRAAGAGLDGRVSPPDRLALTSSTGGRCRADDFDLREGGGVALQATRVKAVVVAYQSARKTKLPPAAGAKPALGLVPLVQSAALARALRDDTMPYLPFVPQVKGRRHAGTGLLRREYRNQRQPPPPGARVAKVCEHRTAGAKSVFECQVDVAQFETLERRLLAEINPDQDCLRLYRMPNPGSRCWSTAASRRWILMGRWCCRVGGRAIVRVANLSDGVASNRFRTLHSRCRSMLFLLARISLFDQSNGRTDVRARTGKGRTGARRW